MAETSRVLGAVVGPPPPEHVVERRVEAVTFAEARAYFTDCEAGLMPDFEQLEP